MNFPEYIDLSSDDEVGEADIKVVKQEPDSFQSMVLQKEHYNFKQSQWPKCENNVARQDSEENISSNDLNAGQSSSVVLDHGGSPIDGSSASSTSPGCTMSLSRQFWKAGNYDVGPTSEATALQNGKNLLSVHPMFLHSNATSHKWAFSAVAELLDNAVDEIQNGATFVIVDKISNPRDGSPALLIQDDGGGMDPDSMRQCMSFGFSDKKSKSAIGQYGNGFKTSTMRLGADVIVFSRHINKRTVTQSIGLLSYSFLRQTNHDRIVVPMVDYEFDPSTGTLENILRYGREHFSSNLSMLLQWSPHRTEAELLMQFDDIGHRGTKVIIYNLWFTDDGELELDFESDPEDILISGGPKAVQTGKNTNKMKEQQHIANRLHYSLRIYSSILYMRIPQGFRIMLRGKIVEHHNIAHDLRFPEFILYKPQVGGNIEASVITTIGFLKDAPHVGVHGFNVYHRNRLILPFWRVVSQCNSRGRGVVGVLEANFMEPTHNKQDFEKTTLFLKLESRLKQMTLEYWDYHCGLIGYFQVKKSPAIPVPHQARAPSSFSAGRPGQSVQNCQTSTQQGISLKRKEHDHLVDPVSVKRQPGMRVNDTDTRHHWETQPTNIIENQFQDEETVSLVQENKKLHAQCLEHKKREEELNCKVQQLRSELEGVQHEYARLSAELQALERMKEEGV